MLSLSATSATAAAVKVTEQLPALQAQIGKHEVRDAVFDIQTHTLHIVLKNLQRQNVVYPVPRYQTLLSQLTADGAHILYSGTKHEASKSHHHLRYIAGGVVIVAVIGMGGLLYVRRRRYQAEGGAATPPSAS